MTDDDNRWPPQQHREPPPRVTARGVGMGATPKRRADGNAATRPNGTTTQQQDDGRRREVGTTGGLRGNDFRGGEKAQATSFDVSWAVGKFLLFLFHVFLLLNFFRYLLELLTTKVTQHPPPPLRAAARGVVTGATPKQRDDGHAAIRPN